MYAVVQIGSRMVRLEFGVIRITFCWANDGAEMQTTAAMHRELFGKKRCFSLPSTPELNWKLAEGEPHALVERLQASAPFPNAKRILTIDGVRAEYADGFGLARASNTTPVIVLRFEADTEEALARIQGEFRAALQPLKPQVPLPF